MYIYILPENILYIYIYMLYMLYMLCRYSTLVYSLSKRALNIKSINVMVR